MRVWIVNQYTLPPDQPGGTRHYFLARELVRQGHEVYLVASNINYATRQRFSSHTGIERIDGVHFVWLKSPVYKSNSFSRLWNNLVFTAAVILSPLMGRLPRPDVVIGSSPHPFGAWAAEWVARRMGVPFLFEVRDLWPQSLVDLGSFQANHPFVRALRGLEHHLYKRAERIITLLPRAVDYVTACGFHANKVVWIPNGIDLSLVPEQRPASEKPAFTVMYTGSHGVGDGLEHILEAARLIENTAGAPPVVFRFIGDGIHKERLQQEARDKGLTSVSFETAVPRHQVFDRLEEADALVAVALDSPLYRWGLSFNKLFDYLAAGRPIVFAAEVPCNPIAESGAGLTVPPNNPQALADAIIQLACSSASALRAMGEQGRKYVAERHDVAQLSRQLSQVLAEVVRTNDACADLQRSF